MTVPLLDPLIDAMMRRCPVPGDLDDVTSIGSEQAGNLDAVRVDAVWARAQAVYRSGMHPALQLCIRHRGDVVLDRAIGHSRGVRPGRRLDHPDALPLTVDTPINLFSAGKAVTGMVMHKLEEQGHLDLDDPVARHLPAFARHGKGAITLRQVLTHRAGIPSLPSAAMDLAILSDHERVVELVCDLRPSARPGGPPAYHAITGGFVMEAVAREATGRSLREIIVTEIKQPLGLRWFDYGTPVGGAHEVAANVITGVPMLPPLSLFASRVLGIGWDDAVKLSNDPRFVEGVIPSGNVLVTARDVATFYQCLLQGGELDGVRVFDPKTIERAIRADRGGIDIDRTIGLPISYSAGFMLGTPTISLYGWNHPRAFGHVGLSNSFTWADPDRDLVVALLTTGKAMIGTHMGSLMQLMREIHRAFPVGG